MSKFTRFVLAAALAGGSCLFGETPNSLMAGQKALYEGVSDALVRGAEKMPEENYTFRPTPKVRSFAELVGHAADAQMMFCSVANGSKPPSTKTEGTKTTKQDLVEALKESAAFCDKVYGSLTDAEAAQTVNLFGHTAAKLNVLSFNTAHADEHYGNMVTYLRLKDIVPPTSERGPDRPPSR